MEEGEIVQDSNEKDRVVGEGKRIMAAPRDVISLRGPLVETQTEVKQQRGLDRVAVKGPDVTMTTSRNNLIPQLRYDRQRSGCSLHVTHLAEGNYPGHAPLNPVTTDLSDLSGQPQPRCQPRPSRHKQQARPEQSAQQSSTPDTQAGSDQHLR
ncbi:hypothetical protein EYF80_002267 [Liparis tanakae]|uniref:Uncharacterized protein n=1 Tax=Liparis tanakae TaxID=230148 RepID=A0A4Z2JBN4_9TELE|nr:hypothetical protein EYF80_002267 [Liparis tanakae]